MIYVRNNVPFKNNSKCRMFTRSYPCHSTKTDSGRRMGRAMNGGLCLRNLPELGSTLPKGQN